MARKFDSLISSIIVLFIASAFFLKLQTMRTSSESIQKKPQLNKSIGEWQLSREIPISDDILSILGTRGAVLGEYMDNSGDKIWLYILKSLGRRSSIHQPEYCYVGSGRNELLEQGRKIITLEGGRKLPVNYLFVQNDLGFQVILYYYTVGDFITNNYYLQQLVFLGESFKNKNVTASLVRISKFTKDRNFSEDLITLQHLANNIFTSRKTN